MTLHIQRSTALALAVYAGFAWLSYLFRRNSATVAVLVAIAALHAWFSLTSIHSVIILFAGHGMELIIAMIFLFRAFSGQSIVHAAERPLYAWVGCFILFHDLAFAYRLVVSSAYRAEYAGAKGGDIDMDFVRIAGEYLHIGVVPVAKFFLVCCVATPIIVFLIYRYSEGIHRIIARLAKN